MTTQIQRDNPQDSDGSRPATAAAAAAATVGRGYFPLSYITGMFDYFKRHSADISILTYDEFPWDGDKDYQRNYPTEHASWTAGLKSGRFDKSKSHVVIQYDVDTSPHRTFTLLRHPSHRGLPANIMIFNRCLDRRKLGASGVVEYLPYPIEDAYLHELQQERFVVGYHSNAYEQGGHNTGRAHTIFDADVRALTQRFGLSFFSAHGGVPDKKNLNNCDLPFHPDWSSKLHWVHNGYSPHFDGQFSDGGHNSKTLHPVSRDLREFVAGFRPGARYRILLHPQYYASAFMSSKRYGGTPWYDEILDQAGRGEDATLWSDAAVALAASRALPKSVMLRAVELASAHLINKHWRFSNPLRRKVVRLLRR